MQKNADLKNLYYPFWVRAGGPSAREGRARARARARALSTPAFQGRTSESRLFCYVNLRSVSGKVVQFLEFGNCAKSNFNPCRFREVMMKMKIKPLKITQFSQQTRSKSARIPQIPAPRAGQSLRSPIL